MTFIKSIKLLTVFLLVFTFSFGTVLAQEQPVETTESPETMETIEPPEDLGRNVVLQDEQSPLIAEVIEVSVDSEVSSIYLKLNVSNNSGTFLSDLILGYDILSGEELKTDGYIFEGFDYIYSDEVSMMKEFLPEESQEIDLVLPFPENINSGDYYLRLIARTKDNSLFYITNTETSESFEGNGGFSYIKDTFVRNAYEETGPLDGYELSLDDYIELVVPKENNSFLSDSGNINAQIEIYSFQDDLTIHTEENLLSKYDSENEYVFRFENIEGMKPGPYEIKLTLTDSENLIIAPSTLARWLIGGLYVRAVDVEFPVNYLEKGDEVSLTGNLIYGPLETPENVILEANIYRDGVISETFSKEFSVGGDLPTQAFDFSDFKVKKEGLIDKVELNIKDSSGKSIFIKDLELSDKEIVKKAEDESPIKIYVIISIILLIILALVFVIIKNNKKNKTISTLAMIFIFGLGVLLQNQFQDFVNACSTGDCGALTMNASYQQRPTGNLGWCPQTGQVKFSISATCPHCLNNSRADVYLIVNGVWNKKATVYPAPDSNGIYGGPYVHNLNLNSGNTWKNYRVHFNVYDFQSNNYCKDSAYWGPVYTASCSVQPPAQCGSANGGTYDDWSDIPNSGYCAVGTADSKSVNSEGNFVWRCAQTNAANAWCSATKTVPPPPPADSVAPQCGTDDGETFASNVTPTNLCSVGTASSVQSNDILYSWTCLNDSLTEQCSATRQCPSGESPCLGNCVPDGTCNVGNPGTTPGTTTGTPTSCNPDTQFFCDGACMNNTNQDQCTSPDPEIIDFSPNPRIIDEGGTCELSWTVENSTSCQLSANGQDIGEPYTPSESYMGQITIPGLTNTTSYTLTCSNEGGGSPASDTTSCIVDLKINQN